MPRSLPKIFASLIIIAIYYLYDSILKVQKSQTALIKKLAPVEAKINKLTSNLGTNYRNLIDKLNTEHYIFDDDIRLLKNLHDNERRKNLRLKGVPSNTEKLPGQLFRELCEKKLNIYLQPTDFDMIQWAGQELHDGTRTIVAQFTDFKMKEYVLERGKLRLRGTKFIMFEDLYTNPLAEELKSLNSNGIKTENRLGNEKCAGNRLASISDPTVVKRSGMPFGAWLVDTYIHPESNKPDNRVYFLDHFYRNRIVKEYTNITTFADDELNDEYTIPNQWAGTGHVVYNRNIYYPKYNSSFIIKYSLEKRRIQKHADLPNAVFGNQAPYQWRGSTDIDLAVDENGLWAIYATEENELNLVVSRLDWQNMEVIDTWETSWRKAWSGNAFMMCGVMYAVKRYDETLSEIHYAFDTKTGQSFRPRIPITIPFKWLAYLDYNPVDRKLYAWDNGNQLIYDVETIDDQVDEALEAQEEVEEIEDELSFEEGVENIKSEKLSLFQEVQQIEDDLENEETTPPAYEDAN